MIGKLSALSPQTHSAFSTLPPSRTERGFKSGGVVGKSAEGRRSREGRRRRRTRRAFGARTFQEFKAFPMEQQPDRVQPDHHLEFPGFFLGLLGFVTRDQSLEERHPVTLEVIWYVYSTRYGRPSQRKTGRTNAAPGRTAPQSSALARANFGFDCGELVGCRSLVVTSAYLSLIPSHSYSSITSVTVYNTLSTPTVDVDAASAGFIPDPRARRPTNTTATRSLPAPVTRPSGLVLPYETDPSRLGSRAPSQAIYTLTDTVGLTFAPIRAHMTACLRSSTTATTATTTRENVERGLCAQRGRRRAAEDERVAWARAIERTRRGPTSPARYALDVGSERDAAREDQADLTALGRPRSPDAHRHPTRRPRRVYATITRARQRRRPRDATADSEGTHTTRF
ncbi:hypothetical protein FB107DRAFT_252742, partial [Schizophyllum commune]